LAACVDRLESRDRCSHGALPKGTAGTPQEESIGAESLCITSQAMSAEVSFAHKLPSGAGLSSAWQSFRSRSTSHVWHLRGAAWLHSEVDDRPLTQSTGPNRSGNQRESPRINLLMTEGRRFGTLSTTPWATWLSRRRETLREPGSARLAKCHCPINRLPGHTVSLELERDEVGEASAGRTPRRRRPRRSSTFGPKSDAVTASAVAPQRGVTV
jgi:hypothetical protein